MELKEGWEVEWCADIPVDERGELIFDCADYRSRDFKSERAAKAWIPTAQTLDIHGQAVLVQFTTNRYGQRDTVSREVFCA